jgi:peroxiredoxin
MKIFSLSQGGRRLLSSAVFGWSVSALGATLYLPNDSTIFVNSVTVKKTVFLAMAEVQSQLPVMIRADAETGLSVLCTTHDCRPVYVGDEQEALVSDSGIYLSANAVAEALGCGAKIKRKRDVYLTCAEGWPPQRVGAEVGQRAPGFQLKAGGIRSEILEETPLLSPRERRENEKTAREHKETPLLSPRERGEKEDSIVTLNDLLSRGPVVVVFVRSGDWDPLSRLLLDAVESKLDSLRGEGCEVVAIHGYEAKVGAKWAAELKLRFAQLADDASAVMRGYEVFDQGHLPLCAVFLLDRNGIIRYRQVLGSEVTMPDLEPLMQKLKDEG